MTVLAQVRMQHDSGLSEDAVINTFHFNPQAISATIFGLITDALESFYNDVTPPTVIPIAGHLSRVLSGVVDVTYYDLDTPQPRQPVGGGSFTMPVASDDSLPAEVALCLSFQGTVVSGENPANFKNRVFIGPLEVNTLELSAGAVRPTAQLMDCLADAGTRLKAQSQASAGAWTWVTWSPTIQQSRVVTSGWVDNAFDTQRRRGEVATSRLLWS